jgi:hypothetical protein
MKGSSMSSEEVALLSGSGSKQRRMKLIAFSDSSYTRNSFYSTQTLLGKSKAHLSIGLVTIQYGTLSIVFLYPTFGISG